MMLDATVWNFQQREDRRAARKLLNNKMPRCILANGVEENDYALELAKWQYRTGTGFLLTTKNKDDKLRKLVKLPGVIAISFGKQWTYGSKLGSSKVTTLVTNVQQVAKSIFKSLKKAELEEEEHFTKEEASAVLQKIAEGCKEELKRQRQLFSNQEKIRQPPKTIEVEEKWLTKRGKDLGQKAACVLVQWAKQEQELDGMTRTWESALELTSSDDEESSAWSENRSTSHQPPPSSPISGSKGHSSTVPEGVVPTDPETKVARLKPTIP